MRAPGSGTGQDVLQPRFQPDLEVDRTAHGPRLDGVVPADDRTVGSIPAASPVGRHSRRRCAGGCGIRIQPLSRSLVALDVLFRCDGLVAVDLFLFRAIYGNREALLGSSRGGGLRGSDPRGPTEHPLSRRRYAGPLVGGAGAVLERADGEFSRLGPTDRHRGGLADLGGTFRVPGAKPSG
jgi:hypothetical protein